MNSSAHNIPDQDLLNYYYLDGNNKWIGILLQRYSLLLFGVCMKYLKNEDLAKDAVQQVFEKAINELSKYKVEYVKSWLYMIAKNYCLMQLRGKSKLPIELKEQYVLTKVEESNMHELLQKNKQLDELALAITELLNEQRICIEQFYLQKKSYSEIANNTGYSLHQVKSYIQNGKRNLKIILMKKSKNEQ